MLSLGDANTASTCIMSLSRPARLQVDPESITDDDKPPQTGHTFNVWYLKWAGGDSHSKDLPQSKFRVNVERDAGYTKATDGRTPLCLFFARGCCYKGKECHYSHRTPRISDVVLPTQDCFGRDKTTDYNDDMSGVGSLQKSNRTLYVSGAHMNDQVHEQLSTQFSEFGSIDKIRVLQSKGCAFISFRLETEAQFAKEAMNQQSLDGKDVLSVKWANDDPNPTSHQSTKRHMEEMAMETVRKLLKSDTKGIEAGLNSNPKSRTSLAPVSAAPDTESSDVEAEPDTEHEATADKILGPVRLAGVKNLRFANSSTLQAALLKAAKIVDSPTYKLQAQPVSTELLAGYSSDQSE